VLEVTLVGRPIDWIGPVGDHDLASRPDVVQESRHVQTARLIDAPENTTGFGGGFGKVSSSPWAALDGVEIEAPRAGDLFDASGRRRGTLPDCVIAGTALLAGAALATGKSRGFRRCERVGLR
jgi:hypothetical protein